MEEDNKDSQIDEKTSELWKKLREHGANSEELCEIIEDVKGLREEAWKELKRIGPPNNILRYILILLNRF